jgi:protein-tyrosine phosphatase
MKSSQQPQPTVTSGWLIHSDSAPGSVDARALIMHPMLDAVAERLDGGDMLVAWGYRAGQVTVFGGKQPYAIDRDVPLAFVTDAYEVVIPGLNPPAPYYFELHFAGGDHDGERLMAAERILPTEGLVNFRDIGGYRAADGQYVRWGQIYRTGDWTELTVDDLNLINRLNIRLVCDLRSENEVRANPNPVFPVDGQAYLHLPLTGGGDMRAMIGAVLKAPDQLDGMVGQGYIQILENGAEVLSEIFHRFADPNSLPLVFNCSAGKDRTGIIAALLLSLLGVPEETIVADYTLSNLAFEQTLAAMAGNESIMKAGLTPVTLAPLMVVKAQWIRAMLSHVSTTYGSMENYLTDKLGLDTATLAAIRSNLLD